MKKIANFFKNVPLLAILTRNISSEYDYDHILYCARFLRRYREMEGYREMEVDFEANGRQF